MVVIYLHDDSFQSESPCKPENNSQTSLETPRKLFWVSGTTRYVKNKYLAVFVAKNWGENKEHSERSPTQLTSGSNCRALLPRFSLNQRVPGVAPFSLRFCQSRFNETIWNFFKSIRYKLKGHWPLEITGNPSVHSNCLNIEVRPVTLDHNDSD